MKALNKNLNVYVVDREPEQVSYQDTDQPGPERTNHILIIKHAGNGGTIQQSIQLPQVHHQNQGPGI